MKRFNPGSVLFAVLLAMVLTAAGCSTFTENSPTDPGDTGSTSTSSTDSYAEAFIRANVGGTLVLGENSVYFPPGALSEDTLVSIIRDGHSTPYNMAFDLNPDGILFNKSVTLTLKMAAPGLAFKGQFMFPSIYYFNEQASQWQSIGGQPDYQNRVIRKQINHFSRYGTGVPWLI